MSHFLHWINWTFSWSSSNSSKTLNHTSISIWYQYQFPVFRRSHNNNNNSVASCRKFESFVAGDSFRSTRYYSAFYTFQFHKSYTTYLISWVIAHPCFRAKFWPTKNAYNRKVLTTRNMLIYLSLLRSQIQNILCIKISVFYFRDNNIAKKDSPFLCQDVRLKDSTV